MNGSQAVKGKIAVKSRQARPQELADQSAAVCPPAEGRELVGTQFEGPQADLTLNRNLPMLLTKSRKQKVPEASFQAHVPLAHYLYQAVA